MSLYEFYQKSQKSMLQKGVTSQKVAKTITAKNSKINKFAKLISQKLFIILWKKLKKKKEMGKNFLITNFFCIAFDKLFTGRKF